MPVKDKSNGTEQAVTLPGGSKTYHCPAGAAAKISPHDLRAGRVKLTLQQVRRQESKIEKRYSVHLPPAKVADRYQSLIRRDQRLVKAFNEDGDARNAIVRSDWS